MSTTQPGLRTTSLRRRVVLFSLAVLLVVLAAAGVLTDVLLGRQLRSDAETRLDGKVSAAQSALGTGARPQEVVAAAQGDGVTASLVTSDGETVVGNTALKPAAPPAGGPAGRPAPAGPGQAAVPTVQTDPQQLTARLPDGSLLTVAVDTAGISAVQAQLRRVLVPLLVGALVLAGLLLAVVTSTALRPLDRMTALARSITRGQRGRRLDPDRTSTELGRTAGAFDEMLDALEGAEASLVASTARAEASEARTRRFVADAAHELRTPLAGVQAASEAVIAAGPDVALQERERLQLLVVRESRRAGRLVADLLSLARIDSGLALQPEPLDLAALVRAEAERARLLAPRLAVTVGGADQPVPVVADGARLAQVLTNLLDNARRYTPGHGRVHLQLSAQHPSVLVLDDGPGVAPPDRERVFDRLVRLDTARTSEDDLRGRGELVVPDVDRDGATAGSGLGLSIARGIARAHGGDLRCVAPPAPWPGAAFLLELPGGAPLS